MAGETWDRVVRMSMHGVQDPTKRPTARALLEHRFFKHVPKDRDYMRKHLIAGLPDVITRVQHMKDGVKGLPFEPAMQAESRSNDQYVRGLSAWNFDVAELKRQVLLSRTSYTHRPRTSAPLELPGSRSSPCTLIGISLEESHGDIKQSVGILQAAGGSPGFQPP